jgi:hypothetical protein
LFKKFTPSPIEGFNRFAELVLSAAEGFNPPALFLPANAGEDAEGGLNDWHVLNGWNAVI